MNKKEYNILSAITIGGIFGNTVGSLFFSTFIPIMISGILGMVVYYCLERKNEKR